MARRAAVLAVFAACALFARTMEGAIGVSAYPNGPAGAAPGGTMIIDTLVLNNGPQSVSNVTVTATLPEHTTLVKFTYTGGYCSSPTPSTISCTATTMSPVPYLGCVIGTHVTLAVDPSATPDTPLPYTVDVKLSNTTVAVATTTPHVFGPTDPAVVLSAPPTAHDDMTYTVALDLTNNGPSSAYNSEVDVTLKTNTGVQLYPVSCTLPAGWQWTSRSAGQSVSIFRGPSIATGTTTTLLLNYAFGWDLDATASSLVAEAVLSDPYDTNPDNNTSTANIEVVPPPWPDITVSLDSSSTQAKAGELITFTMGVTNASLTPADNVIATLNIAPTMKLVSSTLPCPDASCSLGPMAAGATKTYTAVAQVLVAGPRTIQAVLQASATNEHRTDNNTAARNINITQSTEDLAIAIAAPAVIHPGPVQWTFNVTNSGPDAGSAFFIRLLMPVGTTLSRFIGPAADVCTPPLEFVPRWISCTGYGLFMPHETWSVTVELNVSPSAPSPVEMPAAVVPNDHSYDPVAANNTATASSVLVVSANLSIAVIASDTSETWEYHVINNGPDLAKSVEFSMKVPDGVAITSVRSNTGRCDFSGCLLGDLLPQAMDTVWVTLHPTKTGLFQVFANAEAANAPLAAVARMLRTRGAPEGVDLSFAASMTPQVLYVGDIATFTYYVTNRSNPAADDATIEIQLPPQFSFVSGSPGCDATHCALGTIVSGDTVSATITAVATSAGYTCTDSHASCAKAEVNEADNAASQLAVILPAPASRHRAAPH